MKRVRGNKLLLILMALATFSLALVTPSFSLQWEAKMMVTPAAVVDTSLGAGSTFTVDIIVKDITDLYGFEFKLAYDTSILTTTMPQITIGDIFDPGYFVWKMMAFDSAGYVWIAVTQELGAIDGVSVGRGEKGRLASIEFTVDGDGSSVLDIYDVKLADSSGDAIGVLELADGFFSNVDVAIADLATWKAKPEHHAFSFDRDNDGLQSFYGNVRNYGTLPVEATVRFTIYDSFGGFIDQVDSTQATIAPGATMVLEATWDGMEKGERYFVEAQAFYGTASPNTAGLSVYSFDFHVLPPPKIPKK